MNMVKTSIWVNFITVSLSIFVSALLFLIADFAFSRSILPEQQDMVLPPEQKPYLEGDHGWYELKRDFVGSDSWGKKVYPVKTDHFGFRVNDRHDAVTAGDADVIFLGDSYTYGINGSWSETFVGMLEGKLERHVVNAGVSSYSPTVYLYQYQKALDAGILSQGHSVVVALDISDIQDEATRWESGSPHPILLSPPVKPGDSKPGFGEKIKSRLMFTQRIAQYLRHHTGSDAPDTTIYDMPRSAFTWKSWDQLNQEIYPGGYAPLGVSGGIQRTTSQLTELDKLVKQKKAKLYFLIYPWPAQIKHGMAQMDWERYVNDLCKKLACAGVINTFPVFRQIAERDSLWYKEYFIEGDVHFSTLGNSVVFGEIAKTIH